VTFWSKLFGKRSEPPPENEHASGPPPRTEQPPAEAKGESEIDRLRSCGLPTGPSAEDAIELLRRLRNTADQGPALEAVCDAAAARPLAEEILVAAASALASRGDSARAVELLKNARSPAALLMRSDLEAERGDVAGALSLVERVLLRDLDYPGAIERHRMHRATLGLGASRTIARVESTVVAAEPESPYLLLREVARGGAGAVYEAEDRELGRRLALKVYHDPVRDRAQMMHEVGVAVSLADRGIVRVFDVDPDHGWIALEWAPLGALRERVRARDLAVLLPLERWLLPLARALAHVHDAGLVHLDVKPANVLMLAPDDPVLADFGIARRVGEVSPAGSMGYESPERLAKRPADFRDDVYAFGRIIEDVLDAVSHDAATRRLEPLAKLCTGRLEARPAHARDLVVRLMAEVPG
jgi:hypothetical protein